jgi:hypothetical protein
MATPSAPTPDIVSRLSAVAGDELREQPRLSFEQAIDIAQRNDLAIDWRDLTVLSELFGARDGQLSPPRHLVEFLAQLAAGVDARRVLDPFVSSPTVLAACVETVNPERALGLVPNELGRRTAEVLNVSDAEWRVGEPLEQLGRVDEQFDLIVGLPPLAHRPRRQAARLTGGDSVRGEYAWALLVEAAPRLADEGTLALLTTEAIHWRRDARELQLALSKRELHLSAVVSVGAVLGVGAELDLNLVVFGRQPRADLWVGRLTPDMNPAVLVDALLRREAGEVRELGRLMPRERYTGWRAMTAAEEWDALLTETDVPVAPLATVAGTLRRLSSAKLGDTYELPANAVYLPEWVSGKATLAPELDDGRNRTFIEISLDPERVQAAYFASWLNSRAGRLAREQAATGTGVRRLSAEALGRLTVPLPPLPAQLAATQADRRLTELLLRAEQLRERLWLSPDSAQAALAEIGGVRTEESFETWLSRLPFPIAVIAHHYHAGGTDHERVERLLHFFEATAQFCSALLISAIRRDPTLHQELRPRLAQAGPDRRPVLERSTFGTWLQLGQTAAKALRGDLNDPDRREQRRALFASPTPALAELLVDKALWRLLDVARTIRNANAHGGVRSPAESARQLDQLAGLLVEFRTLSANAFDDVELIRAGPARIAGHSFTYEQAERLTGSNPVFVRRELRSVIPLDELRIYLVASDGVISNALAIVPLFVLREPPTGQMNAVYFYNGRARAESFNFVSYHFASEPTSEVEDPAVTELVQYLTPQPSD